AKTTGSFLTRGSCSEPEAAVFDCEDFSPSRFAGKATCGARRPPGAQIPLSLSASGKNADKSSAAKSTFFAMPSLYGIVFLRSCAQAHKIVGRSTRLIAPPVCTDGGGSSCIFRGSRFSYRESRDRSVRGPRGASWQVPDARARQSQSD